ncbi:ArdC-like ssDNA-binding domain-containing protein [Microbacterium oxydans]|uniref:ArdC-like ssDNA-binding domain-containing protein n=1 Tax=Microbacterium oxydans TaxID=82380 RepID=UPI0036453035
MAATDDRRAAREAKLDEVHEKLADAVDRLVSGDDWANALTFAAQFRSRSFNNTLLIWIQHSMAYEAGLVSEPMPSYVAGYRQWQQLGRQVAKGQPGYQILAPVTGRFASSSPSDPASWRRLNRFEKPRPGEVVRSKMIGVRPAYVWDASQTSGDPLPTSPTPTLLKGEAPSGLWAGLAEQIRAAGFTVLDVAHEGMIHGANGVTDYTEKTVTVRENMDPAARVKTLAHELAHVLMHGPNQDAARQHRGVGEVEAESVALMIGAAHGMDTSGYTIPYVSTWAAQVDGQEPAEIVRATGERVRATAMKILDQLDTQTLGDGTPPGLERASARTSVPASNLGSHAPVTSTNAYRAALTESRSLR